MNLYLNRFLIAGFFALMPVQIVRAQSSWTAIATPSVQDLKGVCYGGGQYVAVGNAGTVLTSASGSVWVQQTIGTPANLTAITYGNGLYVAVGENGVIVTSPDGIAWTTRASGGAKFTGVAYGDGQYMVVGNSGTIRSSNNGVNWTDLPYTISGNFVGVAYTTNRFVAVTGFPPGGSLNSWFYTFPTMPGVSAGTLAVNVFIAPDFTAIVANNDYIMTVGGDVHVGDAVPNALLKSKYFLRPADAAYFQGAAFFNNRWVAVGLRGAIMYGQPHAMDATLVPGVRTPDLFSAAASPSSLIAVGSGGAVFRSVPDVIAPEPFLLNQSATVIVAIGASAQLDADALGSLPLSFQWNLNGSAISGATSRSLALTQLQPNQTGEYTLTATNSAGTRTSAPYYVTVTRALALSPTPVDSMFVPALATAPRVITPQPDGKILIAGDEHYQVAGHDQNGIARLNADGTLDASYNVGSGIDSGIIRQLELQPDGKVVVVGTFTAMNGSPCYGAVRLNADGSRDASFAPPASLAYLAILRGGGYIGISRQVEPTVSLNLVRLSATGDLIGQIDLHTVLAGKEPSPYLDGFSGTADNQGRLYVRAIYGVGGKNYISAGYSVLFRLLQDGSVDPSFSTVNIGSVAVMRWIGGKLCYQIGNSVPYYINTPTIFFGKLNEDGTADPAFPQVETRGAADSFPWGTFTPDGGLIVSAPYRGFIRYAPNGTRDYAVSANLDEDQKLISNAVTLPSGDILAVGRFISLNGVPAHALARLHLTEDAYATHLANFSVRSTAGSGEQTLITGFIVGGVGSKNVLIRGAGPTLVNFGVAGAIADPLLNTYHLSEFLASNDNWDASLQDVFWSVGAFGFPSDSRDAALLVALPAGSYSAHVLNHDPASAPGIALAEFYDTDASPASVSAPRLVNMSARSIAGTGEKVLIGGFIVSGPGIRRFLIRAVGPGLAPYGIVGFLPNPQLRVYAGSTVIAANDEWSTNGSILTGPVATATTEVNTFALTDHDAAVVLSLPAGAYSAQVSGVGGTTGVALVEIYELP